MPPIIIYHFIKKRKCTLLPTIFYKTFFCFNYEVVIVKITLESSSSSLEISQNSITKLMSMAWFIIIWCKSSTVPGEKQHGVMVDQGPPQQAVVLDSHALWVSVRPEHSIEPYCRKWGHGHNYILVVTIRQDRLFRPLLTLKPLAGLELGPY